MYTHTYTQLHIHVYIHAYTQWQGQAINAMTDAGARPFNPTGVSIDTLKQIGMACLHLPEGFLPHENIRQVLNI